MFLFARFRARANRYSHNRRHGSRSAGAVVPGATVVAKNVDTGISRTTRSTSEGLYRFDNLPPGVYDVSVEAQGFAKGEAKSVKLQVGEQRDLNFNLVVTGTTAT